MKTPTRIVALAVAGIVAITAAGFAAAPQASKREPSVLTLKSNGRPVATLTLNVLNDAPLETISKGGSRVFGKEGQRTKATFFGGVTVRSQQAGERAAFELEAEEIEMQWSPQQPADFAAAPQAPKREPSELTLKSKGKPVATLTLEALDDAPLEIACEGGMTVSGNEGHRNKATFSGGVTVRLRQAGERAAFELKAEEIEMEWNGERRK